ncbi:MAG TPA: fused MFS/spermidine synthase [Usitatibacter sp.]|jgi:SAM-dependent methyltransferase|nr:fused MFS/spermidine synthase [Usitatibacter sp.]
MPLHVLTVFTSAFLLFLVQPVLAKQVLPWFGGGALVWTICMVFFQLVLLLGYAYAHALARLRDGRRQAVIHGVLLAASLAFLPMIPSTAWKPVGGANPVAGILALLFATVGLPYFLLASTSPLVQAWFARERPGESPYRLFALSNLASMLALLGYPFAIEPALTNREQSWTWSAGYALFVACAAALAWRSRASPPITAAGAGQDAAPTPRRWGLWLTLSALGSATLLAVTNHVTQNISSIPLLWVFPLAVYLLTFILCFDGRDWYRPGLYVASLAWTLAVMAWFLADRRLQFELVWQVIVFLVGLYFVCMFCHGELARRRPGPRHLTRFYLGISLGGVIGGVLVGLVAPVVLPGYLELDIALVAAALLAVGLNLRRPWPAVASLGAIAAFVCGAVAWHVYTFAQDTLHMERNYYGVLRVKEGQTDPADPQTRYRSLVHGAILHGEQYLGERYRHAATTYYQVSSGIGRTLLAFEGRPIKVGIIGLGAGSLAVYADGDDTYRFYDINPAVVRISKTYFTYLADASGQIDIVLGDARLSLEREPPQGFDVLAIDAFTGDAIPVHLLTVEAVGEYLRHMKPGGVIAFHVSNRFLDLKPVLLAIADYHHLEYAYVHEMADDATKSDWVLLTRDRTFLLKPTIVEATEPVAPEPSWRLWTDDYNNLLQVFRW